MQQLATFQTPVSTAGQSATEPTITVSGDQKPKMPAKVTPNSATAAPQSKFNWPSNAPQQPNAQASQPSATPLSIQQAALNQFAAANAMGMGMAQNPMGFGTPGMMGNGMMGLNQHHLQLQMQQLQQMRQLGSPGGEGYLNGDVSLLSMDCKEFNRWLKRHEYDKETVDAMKKVNAFAYRRIFAALCRCCMRA